jgi:hypothetical protein
MSQKIRDLIEIELSRLERENRRLTGLLMLYETPHDAIFPSEDPDRPDGPLDGLTVHQDGRVLGRLPNLSDILSYLGTMANLREQVREALVKTAPLPTDPSQAQKAVEKLLLIANSEHYADRDRIRACKILLNCKVEPSPAPRAVAALLQIVDQCETSTAGLEACELLVSVV